MENRYKILSDDKVGPIVTCLIPLQVRSDLEQRARINRDIDEIADLRKQTEDLKYLLSEK
jgi:hypothetical protein